MVFARQLRDRVRSGEITTSIRIWKAPRVKVGGRYPLEPGFVVVEGVREIGPEGITESMAVASGFPSIDELVAVARHGRGDRVFLVTFRYEPMAY